MRIVIDMQGAQTDFSRHRGVGRYTLGLVEALIRASGRHEVILALNGGFPAAVADLRARFADLLPQAQIRVWQQHGTFAAIDPASHPRRDAAEMVREAFLNRLDPDAVLVPNLQEGLFEPAVTSVRRLPSRALVCATLHDVIPLLRPEEYLRDPLIRQWYLERIEGVRQADLVLTVSAASRAEIIAQTLIDPARIHVVANAVDAARFRRQAPTAAAAAALRAKFGLRGRFVLYAGGNDRHKNLDRLFQAYARLPAAIRADLQLVLAGKEIAAEAALCRGRLRQCGIEGETVITGFVADDDFVALLNLADLFVFPSTHEGFGLPPLEAMACGAPVLASSAPSIAEVVGNPQALFDPYDVDGLARLMAKTLMDKQFQAGLVASGLARAAQFRWERSARALLGILEEALAARPAARLENKTEGRRAAADVMALCIDRIAAQPSAARLSREELGAIALSLAESLPPPGLTRGRLFIDISAILINGDHTGIQRVVRAIGAELLGLGGAAGQVQLVRTDPVSLESYRVPEVEARWSGAGPGVAVPGVAAAVGELAVERASPAPLAEGAEPVAFFADDTLLFLDLHPGLAIAHQGKTRYLRNLGVVVYHLVYDLLPVRLPHYFWPALCAEFGQWLGAVAQADGAICISQAVAEELRQWLADQVPAGPRPLRIAWFHLGADVAASVPTQGLPDDAAALLARIGTGPAFLMVGTLEPRKRHAQVLEAFELLWARHPDLNLVFIGKLGWNMADFRARLQGHPEAGRRFHWLSGISDEFLERIYAASACLIAASEGEGFGLPLIEAARHGLPIIARDIPVFREVAGDHAYYFSGLDPAPLAGALEDWLALYRRQAQPRPAGLPWLTWRESAAMLLKVLQSGPGGGRT